MYQLTGSCFQTVFSWSKYYFVRPPVAITNLCFDFDQSCAVFFSRRDFQALLNTFSVSALLNAPVPNYNSAENENDFTPNSLYFKILSSVCELFIGNFA